MMKKVTNAIVLIFCSLAVTACAANQNQSNYVDSILSLRGYTPKPGYDQDDEQVAPAPTQAAKPAAPEFINNILNDQPTPPPPPPPRKKPAMDPLDAS